MTAEPHPLLLRDVEIHGWGRGDCRIRDGLVTGIGRLRPHDDEQVVEGHGGALLPGLADHHLHLAAMAAGPASLDLTGLSADAAATAVAAAAGDRSGWVRAVGYDDVGHDHLDRDRLDRWNDRLPVRVQHRSGALWVVNGAAIERLGVAGAAHPGIERDAAGRPTGRLWRADDWLRDAVAAPPPDLAPVGRRLAALGITHVADATPDAAVAALVAAAVRSGALPQHVMVMASGAAPDDHPRFTVGPVKVIVADHDLPSLDALAGQVARAHAAGRAVAVHCVSDAALALTLAALDLGGRLEGDRIEHCAVADDRAAAEVAARGLRVVTQPTLVTRRGDDYLQRADPHERERLWPYASLLDAGVRVAPSSDAPYGDPDPWACLRAAAERTTASGQVVGAGERVDPETALAGMLSALDDPGGPARRIAVGCPADVVLLDRPLAAALGDLLGDLLGDPHPGLVRATVVEGQVVHGVADLS